MLATVIRNSFRPDQKMISLLRQKIQAIENKTPLSSLANLNCRKSGQFELKNIVPLGVPEVDAALPWNGFPTNGLHEIFGDTAALGFLVVLITRLTEILSQTRHSTQVLWCQQGRDLCGQGLAQFGIDPNQIIFVHGKNDREIIWAMEEGLRSSSLAAVIGKLHKIPPIASRRLHLAAEENETTGLLLRTAPNNMVRQAPTSSALTRWCVTSAPSVTPAHGVGLGVPQWHLELQRCRLSVASEKKLEGAGQPRSWQVEWYNETSDLSVVTDLCNRSDQSQSLWKIAS